MNIHIFFTWVMFLGLFPFSFFWLKSAWKIFIKKDFSHVALKGGKPPLNQKKYAWLSGMISLFAGFIFAAVVVMIIFIGLDYEIWSAIVGITLWMKLFVDFAISRFAHMKWKK